MSFALVCALVQAALAIGFDGTFGTGGMFMTTFSDAGQPSSSSGVRTFIQPSGRIVIVGYHTQQGTSGRTNGLALVGLTASGVLDTSFGSAGKVLLWGPTFSRTIINSILLSDGSILVFYQESGANYRPKVLKLNAAGQVDASFDPDLDLFPNQTTAVWMTSASGGKIYALVQNQIQHYLVRLNADGSSDTTFGPNGVRSVNLGRLGGVMNQPRVFAMEELTNGKFIIAGTYRNAGFEGIAFVARFDNDTNLDRSFGQQGLVRLSIPYGNIEGNTLTTFADGKIMIGGTWTFLGSTTLLFRLTSRGRLDPSFGNGGIAQTNFSDWNSIYSTAVAPDGSIFVAGTCGVKAIPTNQRFFLTKYSAAGIQQQGSLVTNFLPTREAGALDVLVQSDGKILVAGSTQNPSDTYTQLVAARFVP